MLASSGTAPAGDGWAAEVKWDGFRWLLGERHF
jgi:ATP-dependent DNA ligase